MANSTDSKAPSSPALLFNTLNAYQRSAALKGAIDLDVFTAIGEGKQTAADLAARCGAAERGVRILCDYLVVIGFLTKQQDRYGLTQDSAVFLDRKSPAYAGSVAEFILSPQIKGAFDDVAAIVRKGGTAMDERGTLAPEHDVWVKFARAMAPAMALPAQRVAELINGKSTDAIRVLDVAAGHGAYGLAFARVNPRARVAALDWPNVLEVAKQNAAAAGVSGRFETIPGSAFDVRWGVDYDVVLLPNFLHHFNPSDCETVLRKAHAALKPGGRAVVVEFIPDESRVTPPEAAAFSLTMLATTPQGDAYTFPELQHMASRAGFARSELHPLPPTMQRVVVAYR